MISYEPLSDHFGYLVRSDRCEPIDSTNRDQLLERFRSPAGGALLFRGFRTDERAFQAFTEAYGQNFVVHHNLRLRDYVNGDMTFATVDRGQHAIDFHNEMASNPASPDVFWMFCVQPARGGGRTGLVDGVKVLSRLTQRTKTIFEQRGHRYQYPHVERKYWSTILPWVSERADLERWLQSTGAAVGITHYQFDDDDRLTLELYKCPIRDGKFCGRPVFVSGMLDDPPTPLGDEPMPNWIRAEVCQAVYQHAIWIDWQPGDIAWIDNTRVMHAREAFEDQGRRILVRYSELGD